MNMVVVIVSVVLIVLDIILFIDLKYFINKHGDEPLELYRNTILGRAVAIGVISVIMGVLSIIMQVVKI